MAINDAIKLNNQARDQGTHYLAVRKITKSSSTFSATNISSNMIWFLQLHDTIKL